MWNDLREAFMRLKDWALRGVSERRVAKERARFWAGVREGEREAETHSRRERATP